MAVDQVEAANEEELEAQAQEVLAAVNEGTLEVDEDVDIDDPAELKRLIKKLRRENAAKRVKSKEDADAALKWKKHLDSQKSEAEKYKDEAEGLKAQLLAYETAQMQHQIAKEYNLDEDLEEFITGSTEKEMRKKAEKLAEKAVSKPASSASDLYAGKRGQAIGAGNKLSGGQFLEALAKEKLF